MMRFFLILLGCAAGCIAADDFETLRINWLSQNFSVPPRSAEVQKVLTSVRPDGTFADVNYQDRDGGRWDLRRHWKKLEILAHAYHAGVLPERSGEIRAAVIRGIEHWAAKGYVCPNWWYNEIGIPMMSARVLLGMGGAVPEEVRAKFRPILDRSKIGWTALNRLHLAAIQFYKAVIYRDGAMLTEARNIILEELAAVPKTREGLQRDWSFHQHGPMLQFGNYGLAFLATGIDWSEIMNGTKYAVPAEKRRLLLDYFNEGMRWVIYRDVFDFSACGRQITDNAQIEKAKAVRRLLLSRFIFPDSAGENAVREWYRNGQVLEGNRMFFRSDYLIHRRKDLFFSVKMCSARVRGSESTNHENELGRHSAGGLALFLRSGGEYLKCMPLWNWRRLPGVTALQDDSSLRSPDSYYYNRAAFAGGVSDGRNGAAVLRLETSGLAADKTFFCFDDFIYLRTSGIRNGTAYPVNTGVDSRWCRGPVTVHFADGSVRTLADGVFALPGVLSLEHDGMAYRFPGGADLKVEIAVRSGDWKKIHPSYPLRKVSGKMLTIWFDHSDGTKEAEWILEAVPGASRGLRLLNGPSLHAAFSPAEKLAFAVFFAPGRVEIPDAGVLELEQPAAALFRDGKWFFADPAQSLKFLTGRWNGRSFRVVLPKGDFTGQTCRAEWFLPENVSNPTE